MSHPQLDALRAMSPRSRLLQLVQWGVNKMDWAEVLAMGEAAMRKMEETKLRRPGGENREVGGS